jgi:hypothetical protein
MDQLRIDVCVPLRAFTLDVVLEVERAPASLLLDEPLSALAAHKRVPLL